MSFRPLRDVVAVRPFEPSQRTATGIVLPDIAKQKPEQGEVIAVGPGRRDKHGVIRAPALRPGHRVVFSKGCGHEISLDGQKLLVMKESDILSVVERSLFEAWRHWGGSARPLAAAVLVAAISIAAACALGMVG
jgi:chaperonin GroES